MRSLAILRHSETIAPPQTRLDAAAGEDNLIVGPKKCITPFSLIRLIFSALCLMTALLTVFKAPSDFLWLIGLWATEWGYVLALLSLLALAPGWPRYWCDRAAATLAVTALILASSPWFRAISIAESMPVAMTAAFGASSIGAPRWMPMKTSPLSLMDALSGIHLLPVKETTVVYAQYGTEKLEMDIYRPSFMSVRRPIIVVIHGGSWRSGDKGDFAQSNRYLANLGYVVASINYRLVPRWRFPAARDDTFAAISFVKRHAREFGADPAELVLLGRSAGGQLALLAAYTAHDAAIRGVIAFYSAGDMKMAYELPTGDWVEAKQILEEYLGGSPETAAAAYAAASPSRFIGPASPPTLLIHGDKDEIVSPVLIQDIAARLTEARRPHFLLELPWATHGCDINLAGPCGQMSSYAVERFLSTVTWKR